MAARRRSPVQRVSSKERVAASSIQLVVCKISMYFDHLEETPKCLLGKYWCDEFKKAGRLAAHS